MASIFTRTAQKSRKCCTLESWKERGKQSPRNRPSSICFQQLPRLLGQQPPRLPPPSLDPGDSARGETNVRLPSLVLPWGALLRRLGGKQRPLAWRPGVDQLHPPTHLTRRMPHEAARDRIVRVRTRESPKGQLDLHVGIPDIMSGIAGRREMNARADDPLGPRPVSVNSTKLEPPAPARVFGKVMPVQPSLRMLDNHLGACETTVFQVHFQQGARIMAKKPEVNKSQAIRDQFKANPKAKAREVGRCPGEEGHHGHCRPCDHRQVQAEEAASGGEGRCRMLSPRVVSASPRSRRLLPSSRPQGAWRWRKRPLRRLWKSRRSCRAGAGRYSLQTGILQGVANPRLADALCRRIDDCREDMKGKIVMPNQIMVIAPYWLENLRAWVFDDPKVRLEQEPFVSGITEMIDFLVKDIPNAKGGFRLLFERHRSQATKRRQFGGGKKWMATGTARTIRRWRAGFAQPCSGISTKHRPNSR